MIDDTPYIIVDHHKFAPVSRGAPQVPSENPDLTKILIGIVDRVTISREAKKNFSSTSPLSQHILANSHLPPKKCHRPVSTDQ